VNTVLIGDWSFSDSHVFEVGLVYKILHHGIIAGAASPKSLLIFLRELLFTQIGSGRITHHQSVVGKSILKLSKRAPIMNHHQVGSSSKSSLNPNVRYCFFTLQLSDGGFEVNHLPNKGLVWTQKVNIKSPCFYDGPFVTTFRSLACSSLKVSREQMPAFQPYVFTHQPITLPR
jgi:hypothetical protein